MEGRICIDFQNTTNKIIVINIRFVITVVFIITLDWSVCICVTQLYDGTDMHRIYYIKNNYMLCVPFWVIPRRLSSNSRRFGTHCRFHLHRQVNEVCQWMECVGKRWLLELRRLGITQKGTHYI